MNILAFDTETHLIADRPTLAVHGGESGRGKIAAGPFEHPRVVLGSTASLNSPEGRMHSPQELAAILDKALRLHDFHVVGHNLPFDVGVMCAYEPSLRPLFDRAAEEGRLHDTLLLDQLYGLSVGRYDVPRYDPETRSWATIDLKPRTLEALAQDYCGMALSKDPNIRLCFGQWEGRLAELPEDFKLYAIQDAVATLRVFQEIVRRLPADDNGRFLGEAGQVKCSLVVSDLDKRGVHIDRYLATRLRDRFEAELPALQDIMAAEGLGRWRPVPKTTKEWTNEVVAGGAIATDGNWYRMGKYLMRGKPRKKGAPKIEVAEPAFSLTVAALQDALAKAYTSRIDGAGQRADGTVSMEYDYWAPIITPEHKGLTAWLRYQKITKILSTYLRVYAAANHIFPRWWVLGAKTGRMSASCPSIQNVPKTRYGIRALFVPGPGKVFTKADYTAQEMYTLCEAMHNMGIKGPLYDVLASGKDIHKMAAGLVLNKKPEDVTKPERQGQKALNFGVPGGLGPQKLADYAYGMFGLRWTRDEAAERRNKFLDAFPDIAEYLNRLKESQDTILMRLTGEGRRTWAEALETDNWNVIKAMTLSDNPEIRALGIEAERQTTIVLPTGFRRAKCRFTEAANCSFQGLAAAVTKEAAWLCRWAELRTVLIVHDEIVIEHDPSHTLAPPALESAMLEAFKTVCPAVGKFAKVELSVGITAWGKATDGAGNVLDLEALEQ